jgi:hypothetical protein
MVIPEGLLLAISGIVLGLPVVWLGAKYAEQELFQMKVLEPFSLSVAVGILFVAAVLAVLAPAARACAVRPSIRFGRNNNSYCLLL